MSNEVLSSELEADRKGETRGTEEGSRSEVRGFWNFEPRSSRIAHDLRFTGVEQAGE
jgi:hypothetical protein